MLEPVVRGATQPGYRYFAPGSAVVSEGDRRQVFVGGTLVGEFAAGDQAARNALLVQLCQDPRVHLGRNVSTSLRQRGFEFYVARALSGSAPRLRSWTPGR